MSLVIEVISKAHNRKDFDCGVAELNQFLQHQARQKSDKHIAKTYIVRRESSPTDILGYYTLTGYSVITPPDHKDYKLYPHPLSAVKLARLAVDQTQKKQGLGELLVIDAIHRTVMVAEQISTIGLFVDPMTPAVVPFYRQYGFILVNPQRLEMWLPIKTCQDLLD
jgi:predicted GNAT family N-acyltransferase